MDPPSCQVLRSASQGVLSAASSSFLDTRSEPPRYGKAPDRSGTRPGDGAVPRSSAPRCAPTTQLPSSGASVQSSRDPPPSAGAATSVPASGTAASARGSRGPGSVAGGGPESHRASSSGSVAGGGREGRRASCSGSVAGSGRESRRASCSGSVAGGGRGSRRAPSPGSVAGGGREGHRAPSSGSVAGGGRGGLGTYYYSSVSSRQTSCTPGFRTQAPGGGGGGRSSRARDPACDDQPPAHGIDPPDAASLSGPRAGDGGHADPPSRGGAPRAPPSAAGSQEPSALVYQSKHDQLAVWDAGTAADETSVGPGGSRTGAPSAHFSHYLVPPRSPLSKSSRSSGSRSSRASRSSRTSESSRVEEGSAGPAGGGADLVAAVKHALTLRAEEGSVAGTGSAAGGGADPSRALARAAPPDGGAAAPSRALACSPADREGSADRGGALVARDPHRYLSAAADNLQAMVPADSAIYEAYDHTFVTCPERLRFRFLYTFLRKNLDRKVMVFFSTANSVRFHAKLLTRLHVPVITMHGAQTRERFIHRFFRFSDAEAGILCATDAAGRDLDVPPSVDWVVQFEPPDDPSEYILRVARISCDVDRVGRSLLFLNPGEQGFLKYYHSASIPVSEFEIPRHKLAEVQDRIEGLVNDNERLLRASRDAYGSYLIAHASHGFRDVYNVHDLNKRDVASAFGLVGLPAVDDMTMETETIAAGRSLAGGGAEAGVPDKAGTAKKTSWEKKEKPRADTWMKGEVKSWPHSQIKLHPNFNDK